MAMVFGMLLMCEKGALANLNASAAIDVASFNNAIAGALLDGAPGPTFLDAAEASNTIYDSSAVDWIFAIGVSHRKPNGSFDDATGQYGFLDTRGTVATLNFPGVGGGTITIGINSNGQIVGNYYDRSGSRRFSGDPRLVEVPEPNALPFLAACLSVLAISFRRKLNRRPAGALI